jgi:hypothetical protein
MIAKFFKRAGRFLIDGAEFVYGTRYGQHDSKFEDRRVLRKYIFVYS